MHVSKKRGRKLPSAAAVIARSLLVIRRWKVTANVEYVLYRQIVLESRISNRPFVLEGDKHWIHSVVHFDGEKALKMDGRDLERKTVSVNA